MFGTQARRIEKTTRCVALAVSLASRRSFRLPAPISAERPMPMTRTTPQRPSILMTTNRQGATTRFFTNDIIARLLPTGQIRSGR